MIATPNTAATVESVINPTTRMLAAVTTATMLIQISAAKETFIPMKPVIRTAVRISLITLGAKFVVKEPFTTARVSAVGRHRIMKKPKAAVVELSTILKQRNAVMAMLSLSARTLVRFV